MISLDLFGDPVPKKRARTFNNHGRIVTWDSQDKLKEGYKWQIRSQYREEPIGAPVILDVVFMMPIPKSTSKVKQRAMLNGTYHHMCRPDLDNLEKFLMDVLNNVVLKDDAQVVEIHAKKVYSSKPGTYVRIIPIENQCNLPVTHADNLRNHR
jgi:Holliday junction resolvase RusA-like endonuclease